MAHRYSDKLHNASLALTPYTALSQTVYNVGTGAVSGIREIKAVDIPVGGPVIDYDGTSSGDSAKILNLLSDVRNTVFQYVPESKNSFFTGGSSFTFRLQQDEVMLCIVEYLCKVTYNGTEYRGHFYGIRNFATGNVLVQGGDNVTLCAYGYGESTSPYTWTEGYDNTLLSGYNIPGGVNYYIKSGYSIGYETYHSGYSTEKAQVTYSDENENFLPTVYFGNDQNGAIWNNVMPIFLYDLEENYIGTIRNAPRLNNAMGHTGIIFASGGEREAVPGNVLAQIYSSYNGDTKTFTSSFTDTAGNVTLDQEFTDFEITNAWYSGLNFVLPDESTEEKDMFTNMVGLWELAASEQQNLATALEYAQEQNDPILNSIVGMRIFKTPSVDWAKNSAASRIFTREHSGEYTYVNGQKLTNQFNTYTLGTYTFSPHFNNFLDYPPYTKIFLFLPFVGLINLDGNIVMDKTVYIRVSIDAYSGDITYEVRQGAETGGGLPLSTYTSNCSIELPIPSQVNQDYKIGLAIASLAFNAMGAASSGGISGAINGISRAGAGAMDIAGTVISGGYDDIKAERGNLSGGHGWNNYSTPFVMIVRPIDGADASYSDAKGLPTMKTKTLSTCSGFTACIEPKIDCNGTEEEKQTIKSLLESGVIV